jgi:hypothetical protein
MLKNLTQNQKKSFIINSQKDKKKTRRLKNLLAFNSQTEYLVYVLTELVINNE